MLLIRLKTIQYLFRGESLHFIREMWNSGEKTMQVLLQDLKLMGRGIGAAQLLPQFNRANNAESYANTVCDAKM